MTGYRSKKMSSDIRWLGPYAPADRHADDATLAHVVELRKKVAEQERQIANLESYLTPIRKDKENMAAYIEWLQTGLREILHQCEDNHVIESLALATLRGPPDATR
jgi:hypothetical protein